MDNFETYAAKATCPALARRLRMEGRVARKLVTTALERGFTASVYDGEEWTVRKSSDKAEIVNALFTTDTDSIRFHGADGTIGAVFMVYGNSGYDVISDYTASPELNAIMDEVITPYCDRLEQEANG